MSRITHTQKKGKYTRNKKGGEQSAEKIYIKEKLGIVRKTPDNYDPKTRGLKFYYMALLGIYNIIWKNLNPNDKEKLIKDIIDDRGYLAKLRHPLRTRVYNDLVSDLEHLKLMNEELVRDVVLGDFSGKALKTVNGKKGKIHITCGHFNFKYCMSCSPLAGKNFLDINSSDLHDEYGVFSPSNTKSLEASVTELERSPSPSPSPSPPPRSTSNGGKSRRRHRRGRTLHKRRKSSKVRKMRYSRTRR